MKYILIVNYDDPTAIGPFDCEEDAVSYALNVLGADEYEVCSLQTPSSRGNLRLIAQVSA